MIFIFIAAVALLTQMWVAFVEVRETRKGRRRDFSGLLLALGLFIGCVLVFG